MLMKANLFDKGGIQAYLAKKTKRNSTEKESIEETMSYIEYYNPQQTFVFRNGNM